MKILENFSVIEGLDGSGTTTQLQLLSQRSGDLPLWTTFEPTDSEVGLLIRRALRKEIVLPSSTLVYLFAADRDIHVQEILKRAALGLVVSDRYVASSLAYQSLTSDWGLISLVNEAFPSPENLIFLHVDPEICAQRRAERGGTQELFEETELQRRIHQNYLKALNEMEASGVKVHTLDGTKSRETVHKEIKKILKLPI